MAKENVSDTSGQSADRWANQEMLDELDMAVNYAKTYSHMIFDLLGEVDEIADLDPNDPADVRMCCRHSAEFGEHCGNGVKTTQGDDEF
jgi:hypothetical protein